MNGSEPLGDGTGRVGTATGAAPPAFEGPDAPELVRLWGVALCPCAVVTGRGLPLEPPVCDSPPLDPEAAGGGWAGYWSAAA